jgi:hypothetical protein
LIFDTVALVRWISLILIAACGGASGAPAASATTQASNDPPPVPKDAASADPPPAPPVARGIPASCATNDGVCTPDADFASRMCNGSFPDVALVLFQKDSPFTRMYLRGDVDGWNAEGGLSARSKLTFDEEVLVLKRREAPKNGIIVGGAGAGYLVIRWDGNCYTLSDGELTTRKPPAAKHSSISWRYLGERVRDSLTQNPRILAAYQRRGKECKGATSGDVSKTCEQADAALSAAIVLEVRGGLAVPTPEKIP